jgi:hypothetical protein
MFKKMEEGDTDEVFCEICTCLEMQAQRADPFGSKAIFFILIATAWRYS